MRIPRLVIAGTHSGVGKTSIATGLMAALAHKGLVVQPYKVGPDYIDPGYHSLATGRKSRNLDTFLFPAEQLNQVFIKSSQGSDIAVIEGVMGLYDGTADGKASTAEIAKITKSPVLLVVDTRSMAASAAAVVLGFQSLDKNLDLKGVILNKVGSGRHEKLLCQAIAEYTDVEVVGIILREQLPVFPERHLGLLPTSENIEVTESIARLGEKISGQLDLTKILEIARDTPEIPEELNHQLLTHQKEETVPIAFAHDEAFNFYYDDGLEFLKELGAELIPFSPLRDCSLPQGVKGMILGGGFPEMFLERLRQNTAVMADIKHKILQGMPCYAECGGLMYLSETIKDFDGRSFKSAGAVPGHCTMRSKLAGMGYRRLTLAKDCLLGKQGEIVQGHEFHYSTMAWTGNNLRNPFSEGAVDGFSSGNIFASYLHLHWLGNPHAAHSFLGHCREFAKGED